MRRKEEREMENLWKTVTENVGFIVVIAITAAVLFAVAKLGEMWAGVTSSQQMRTKKIVTIGMMSALAFILQIFDFPVPFAPPFYKLDFSEVPVLICSFAMGPVAGVASELLKNVLKVLFRGTTTAFVGDYANFVIGCSFIIPAAILYFKHKENSDNRLCSRNNHYCNFWKLIQRILSASGILQAVRNAA